MIGLTVLDNGRLGLACDRPGKPPVDRSKIRIRVLVDSGAFVIPEIID